MTDRTVHNLKELSTLLVCNHARRAAPGVVLREMHETQYRVMLRAYGGSA